MAAPTAPESAVTDSIVVLPFTNMSSATTRELTDIFAIQEAIAQAIAQRLQIAFPWHGKPLVKTGTPNLEAYQPNATAAIRHYRP